MLKIDSDASSGGQSKLTYLMYFSRPPRGAGLSIPMIIFSYLNVVGSYFFVYSRCLWSADFLKKLASVNH
jgi:hypothetical protein